MRLIDADALIFGDTDIDETAEKIADMIDDAPTVEPVKRGEWVGYETDSYNGTDKHGEPKWMPKKYYRCSECRSGTVIQSAFCSNCGADMRRRTHDGQADG